MSTCPPRWSIPKTGGFSVCSVPRPGAPFRRLRRPSRPFFNRRWVTLVSCHDVDLITFDDALKLHGRLLLDDSLPELTRHHMNIIFVELQFSRNLLVREVQTHGTQAQHPGFKRLVMSLEHCSRQVVKTPLARLALVALPLVLRFVPAVLRHLLRATFRAAHALRPAHLSHHLEALRVVYENLDIEHAHSIDIGAVPCNPYPSISSGLTHLPGSHNEPQILSSIMPYQFLPS